MGRIVNSLKEKQAVRKAALVCLFPFSFVFFTLKMHIRKFATFVLRVYLYAKRKTKSDAVKGYRLVSCYFTTDQLHPLVARDMRKRGVAVPASLSAATINRQEHHSGVVLPECFLDDKLIGKKFATILGLKTPKVFGHGLAFDSIKPASGMVIKPVDAYSSWGVFIVSSEHEILELRTGNIFTSWNGLKKRTASLIKGKHISKDEWIAEECIRGADGAIASDIKFYVFYGKFGWFSEIRRFPEPKHYILDYEGSELDYGLYSEKDSFKGMGASREEISMVEKVSLEIPAPFIRIDFLRGPDGLYFGEFTPRSGVLGYIRPSIDKRFGASFYEAESRLISDLYRGKKFELFNELWATQNKAV